MQGQSIFLRIASILLLTSTYIYTLDGPGTLDTSFGVDGNGIVITNLSRTDYINSCTVQSDDTIVAGGSVNGYFQNMGVARYTSDGALDTTFNSTGTEYFKFGTQATAQGVALQADNKILLTGYAYQDITGFSFVRLNTDGSFDDTFNGSGFLNVILGAGATGYSILVQPDAKIVAGGMTYENQGYFTLVRLNSDGTPDESFGDEGAVLTPINYLASVNSIALQSDQKILAAGYTYDFSNTTFCLARYNTDGSLDDTFGVDGIVQTVVGSQSTINSIAVQDDGFIVAAGYTLDTDNVYKFALTRYDTTGTLDDTFGVAGIVITPIHFEAKINSIALQDDGKIIAGGYTYNDLATEFALARYNTDGTLDATFGTGGITSTTIGGHNSESRIMSIALQSTGDIIAGGYSSDSFALARYHAA